MPLETESRTVFIGSNVFASASFTLSLFSTNGVRIVSSTSLNSFADNSVIPINTSAKIDIMSAVICFAVSLLNTEKISAAATAKSAPIVLISAVISNILIRYPLILSLALSRYKAIPPVRLSAIVSPILENAPAVLPKLYEIVFSIVSNADITP